MENYEKKYKDLVEAVKTLKEANPSDEGIQNWVKDNVPELNKSEDERIMKWCISHFKECINVIKDNDEYKEFLSNKVIAWLEKQGGQKSIWHREDEQNLNACLGYIPDEFLRRWLMDVIHVKYDKPADKVEPKFHEGEWVVYECGEETSTLQIAGIFDIAYVFSDGSVLGIVDEDSLRLWDIAKDAKNGDVLAYKDEISIYKHDIKNCTKEDANFGGFVYHCCYDGKRFITDSLYSLTEKDKKDIYPATEEQRDTLFAKMKEAGYEWDVEKKELKKIENEIEIPFGAKDSELQEATYHIPKGFHAEINGNKVVIKKGNQKPIECIRKDAFVEKAEKYLQEHLLDYWSQVVTDESDFIEDFKNYMKGE